MNKVHVKVGMKGRFKIEAIRPDGTRRVLADWQDNLITDYALDDIGNSGAFRGIYCRVGSGNTTPTFADTSLVAQIAAVAAFSASAITATASSPYYQSQSVTFRFGVGVAAGNLSEMGIAESPSSNLLTRALIKDGGGSPTTITVLSDEVLDVIWQFRVYQTETDWTGTVNISGTDYDVIVRPAFITTAVANLIGGTTWAFTTIGSVGLYMKDAATDLGAIDSEPQPSSGATGTVSIQSHAAYINGNHYRDSTYSAGLTEGNMSYGANFMVAHQGTFGWQVKFDPDIPKDGTKTLALTFRFSWARH